MNDVIGKVGDALLMSAGMAWSVVWSLVLGFVLSGLIQAVVSQDRMRQALGRDGLKEIALATAFGAASSSCSYASASVTRTLFKKGAALVPSLAFLFSSTNLVLELGIVLYVLMGWQFMAAEWVGGLVLVAVMAVLVRTTYPARLVEEARHHPEQAGGHEHSSMPVEGATLWDKLRNPDTLVRVAQNVAMDASMLWKDLVGGFLIAGFLSALVPQGWWAALFLKGASPWLQAPANAVVGPVVAVLSFVCSIGNVPMAAILWASGISFGGVLAFLYADLIVLPLLDVYRRYFGWKMAARMSRPYRRDQRHTPAPGRREQWRPSPHEDVRRPCHGERWFVRCGSWLGALMPDGADDGSSRSQGEDVRTFHRQLGLVHAAVAIASLSACSGQATAPAGLRGFGTPDVSSYLGEGQATSVQAMLERCRQSPGQAGPSPDAHGLEAACRQLHRTMHNQPGNTELPRGMP